jgi:lysophospholipase L1-like esterase
MPAPPAAEVRDQANGERGFAKPLVAALLGIAVALASVEALVRLAAPQPITPLTAGFAPPDMVAFDARYGWKLAPRSRWTWQYGTTIETNALGLRDRDYGPKGPREIRILSLGDSYAFGAGVELDQTYAKVLERKLAARFPDSTITVVNAGISGYGQRQEILAFDDLRPLVEPDAVIATFVAGNDVENNTVFDRQLRDRTKSPLGLVGRHSDAARLVLKTLYPFTDALMNRNVANIDATIALLRELEGRFAGAGLPYRMLVIPARHQIRPESQVWSRTLLRLGLRDFVYRQNRMVIDHFEHDGIPYVDTLEPLATRDAVESVVFDDDAHTNALGHEVIADALLPGAAEMVAEARSRRQRTAWQTP